MRAAVISDIHSNLPALESVLESIDSAGTQEIWCLGDIVGYGAEPDACTDLVRGRCDVCLVGNHDLAALGQLDISSFSAAAAAAARWTQEAAGEETMDFLATLGPSGERCDVGLFHASPRDPVWEYVLSTDQADSCMDMQPQRVSLIGHSHVALFFVRTDSADEVAAGARGAQAGEGSELDTENATWLINPGSVGQPRDGDPRAAWLEIDTEAATARFHRVDYDIDAAASPILEAGLPKHLASRLYTGQ